MSARIAAGKKISLRPLAAGDAAELEAAVAETREELKRRFRWAARPGKQADFIENSAGALAVVDARTQQLVGVGAARASADNPGLAELTFWIRGTRQNAGLGTDAALNLVDRAFKAKNHKVWARVDPGNRAGRRVLKKLGFKFEGCLRRERRLNGRWADLECWGLLKEDRA